MPYFYPDLRRADLRGWVSLCFVFPPLNLTSLRIFPPLFAVSLLAQCSPVCVHRADSADLPRGSHPPADDVLVEQMQARGTETGELPCAGLQAEITTGAPDEPPKNPNNPALPSATLPTAPEQLGSRLGPNPQGTLRDGVFLLPGRNSPLSLCPRLCTSPGVSAGSCPNAIRTRLPRTQEHSQAGMIHRRGTRQGLEDCVLQPGGKDAQATARSVAETMCICFEKSLRFSS